MKPKPSPTPPTNFLLKSKKLVDNSPPPTLPTNLKPKSGIAGDRRLQTSPVGGDEPSAVNYQEFYKKIDGEVYKFYRFGKGEWMSQKTSYYEIPYYEWSETK